MNNFYVYIHRKKSNNEIFYVGKGKGKRAYRKDHRNIYWNKVVNKYGYEIEIYKDNLTEKEAFDLEVKLINELKEKGLQLTNMTDGGEGWSWTYHSEKDRLEKALIHPTFDNKQYSFINEDGRVFYGYSLEFQIKYNLKSRLVRKLIKGDIKSYLNWRLSTTKTYGYQYGENHSSYNHFIFKFMNIKTKEIEKLTQYNFKIKYNIPDSAVSSLCSGTFKTSRGWKCLNPIYKKTNKKEVPKLKGKNNPSYNPTLRIFEYKDGTREILSTLELKEKYNLGKSINKLVNNWAKTYKGWKYLGIAETTPKS